jgi:predicted Holliday junction resolvase-like endonuclease
MESLIIVLLLCLVGTVAAVLWLGYRLMRVRVETVTERERGSEQWRRQLEADVVRREEARFAQWRERELATLVARAQREALVEAHERFQHWRQQDLQIVRRQQRELAWREARRALAEWKSEQEKRIRQDAVQRSQSVTVGKVTEHLVPHLPSFPFNPKDVRFLGSPIDLIVFDGLSEEEQNGVRQVIFLEIKTGASTLTRRERWVRDAVRAGRVQWMEWYGDKEPPIQARGLFE